MKKILTGAAALSFVATGVLANTNYPVTVQKDGVLYNCEATTIVVEGKTARNCIVVGGSGVGGGSLADPELEAPIVPADVNGSSLFAGGLGAVGAAALGAVALVAVAAAASSDNDSTTDTEED